MLKLLRNKAFLATVMVGGLLGQTITCYPAGGYDVIVDGWWCCDSYVIVDDWDDDFEFDFEFWDD